MKLRTTSTFCLLFLLVLGGYASASGEVAQTFTLDGRLYADTAGTTPLTDSDVTITLQILNPAQSCILYEETQIHFDASIGNGYFTLQIGSAVGTAKRSALDSAHPMSLVYTNSVASISGRTLGGGACNYSPALGDQRYIRMQVTPSSDHVVRVLSPSMPLDSVPMAVVAERAENVQGLGAANILQVNTSGSEVLSQANLENIFSSTNYTALTGLLAGSSSLYSKPAANGTTPLANVASPASPSAGQIWYDSGAIKFYDGSSTQTLGVSGAGITSLVAGTGLNVGAGPGGTITTTGTLNVDTGTTTGKLVQVAASNKLPVIDGSNLTNLTGSAISGTIGGSTAVNTSGALTTSGNITGATITGTSVMGTTGSFGSTSTGQLSLYDNAVTNTNYVTLKTPNTATLTADYTLTLPSGLPGSSGQVLTSDTSGNLTWSSPSSGSVVSVTGSIPITVTGTASAPIVNVSAATTGASGVVTLALSGGTTASTVVQATDGRLSDSRAPTGGASGDLSGNYPSPTVAKLNGVALSITSLTTGDHLKYNGTNWVNAALSSADLSNDSNLLKASNMPANCAAGASLTFSSPTGAWVCTTIPDATAVSKGIMQVGTGLAVSSGTVSLTSGIATPGTYPKVTVDTYGRVTAGAALAATDIPSLDWTKITTGTPTTLSGYGITDAVKNLGGSPGVQTGLDASKPGSPSAGTIYFATDTNKIWQYNSGAWAVIASAVATSYSGVLPVANGGTNSSATLNNNRIMTSSGGAIVESAALTNGQLLIGSTGVAPVAAAITAGSGVSVTNGAGSITIATTGLGSTTLADGKIWVGQTTTPTAVTPAGDVTMTNAGSFKVTQAQGTPISATTPTTAGQTLRFNGTSWTPNFISMADLRSTITGASALTSCTSGQTLTWSAATDNLACTNISVTASNFGSQTANTILAAPNGSAGTPTFRTLASADLPSGIVTTGTYKSVTVDTYGRVTAGTNPTTASGYGITDAFINGGNSFSGAATLGTNDNNTLGLKTNGTVNMTMLASGNVGIGTTTPISSLVVRQNSDSYSGGLTLQRASGNLNGYQFAVSSSNSLYLGYAADASSGANFNGNTRFVVDSSGNVGIGTAAPGQMLSVAGTIESTSGGIKFPDGTVQATSATSGTNNTIISGWPDAINCSGASGNVVAYLRYCTAAGSCLYTNGWNATGGADLILTFSAAKSLTAVQNGTGATWTTWYETHCNTTSTVNGSSPPTIANLIATGRTFNFAKGPASQWLAGSGSSAYYNAGNVGIGTATPNANLHIAGTTSAIRLQDTDTASGGAMAAYLGLYDSANAQAGYIGFGGAAIFDIWNTSNTPLRLATNNAERLRIDAAGNVGIGTTSPAAPLHVVGDAILAHQVLYVRDEKASGTDAGGCTAASWNIRTLNTIKKNSITGASVASNQITLPAGTYQIEASTPGWYVNATQAKLYNLTDSADAVVGTSEYSTQVGSGYTVARSQISGEFTIATSKTFDIRQYCALGQAGNGLGPHTGSGSVEVYTIVKIVRTQ